MGELKVAILGALESASARALNKSNLIGRPNQRGDLEFRLGVDFDADERALAERAFDELRSSGFIQPTYSDVAAPLDWVVITNAGREALQQGVFNESDAAPGGGSRRSAASQQMGIGDKQRALLRAIFRATETGDPPIVHGFRMTHITERATIDALVGRFIKVDGDVYRLTLDGLYACDLDEARAHIQSFNVVLPILQELFAEDPGRSLTMVDITARASSKDIVVVPDILARTFTYIVPELQRGLSGYSRDAGSKFINSVRLTEAILDVHALPERKEINDLPREPSGFLVPDTKGQRVKKERNSGPVDTRKVLVIHGRNEKARKAMFAFLRAIGLHPIEWTEAVQLTGHGSPYIGEVLDVAFDAAQAVIALFTGDDEARLRDEFGEPGQAKEPLTPQARPNVIFEAGMAMGRDAHRTIIVELGRIRPFSDIGGRHVVRIANDTKLRQALADRLRTAGCDVNTTGTDWHDTGDFDGALLPDCNED